MRSLLRYFRQIHALESILSNQRSGLRTRALFLAVARLGVRKTGGAQEVTDEAQAAELIEEIKEVTRIADKSAERTESEVTQAARDQLGMGTDSSNAESALETPAESDAKQATVPAASTVTDLKVGLLEDINALIDQFHIFLSMKFHRG